MWIFNQEGLDMWIGFFITFGMVLVVVLVVLAIAATRDSEPIEPKARHELKPSDNGDVVDQQGKGKGVAVSG